MKSFYWSRVSRLGGIATQKMQSIQFFGVFWFRKQTLCFLLAKNAPRLKAGR